MQIKFKSIFLRSYKSIYTRWLNFEIKKASLTSYPTSWKIKILSLINAFTIEIDITKLLLFLEEKRVEAY
jgi:hypothetical protein